MEVIGILQFIPVMYIFWYHYFSCLHSLHYTFRLLHFWHYLATSLHFTVGSCKQNQRVTNSNQKRSKYIYTHTSLQHIYVWPGAHVTDRVSIGTSVYGISNTHVVMYIYVSETINSLLLHIYYSCLPNLQPTCTLHVHTQYSAFLVIQTPFVWSLLW